MDDATKQKIEDNVKNNKVYLFMKGTPDAPQCGFSGQVVSLLQHHNAEFKSTNVLAEEDVRAGIKEYSDWPTIPQLYIDGEFVGGCDVITELHENGELAKLLGKE